MIRLCIISVLMFTLGLVFSPAVRAEQKEAEETKKERAELAEEETSIDAEIKITEPKGAKTEEITTTEETEKEVAQTAEKKTSKDAKVTGTEQKDAKAEKTSPAEEKISGLIAKIEEERAATKEEIAAEEELMLEITGLIIEQTMTKIGYEFYEYFFLFWEAPEGVKVKGYNIIIGERASPLWGSWVQVNVDTTTVWRRVLRPRSTEIEEAVKQAIEATKRYLYRYEEYQFQTEDMVGTGI